MKSAEIRQKFLDYFADNGHERVASSSLVPGNDPTLLFTNAGMVQFKDTFLGEEKRDYLRATSSQRCVRAGGKHNDLENVGYTARHHTFFEMLGNFSFGDYFKREAINFAWQFLTQDLGLPKEKLWVTVYEDDDEAASIWLDEVKIDAGRFSRLGEKDNFWAMGDTGPCGPCSEIFYDHGEEVPGGPPGSPDEDGDRYIEIWNLVFMQFERKPDGSLTDLPKPSVDTGMGLERVAAIMQNVHSNYEIDMFQSLLQASAKACGLKDSSDTSLRVIADHIRSCSFLIIDGVVPSNEGRGYVLRRIVRRAVRHGYQLGVKEIFFYKIVAGLVEVMGDAYPELAEKQAFVEKILKEEEEQFARTLENGMVILEKAIAELDGKTIPGQTVFKLYDTYGFPVDLTADVAREHELSIDQQGFDAAMAAQKNQARAASNFASQEKLEIALEKTTEFTGYDTLDGEGAVQAIYVEGASIDALTKGAKGQIILDRSPFYGESGGQIGDNGLLTGSKGIFRVSDTQKQGDFLIHQGEVLDGQISLNETLKAQVQADERRAITLNHSATHLLHAALREKLGPHVTQKGSLVTAERLRFDFSNPAALSAEELQNIEAKVNEEILANSSVEKEVMSIADAKEQGAMALFGEKYGDEVRVVSMGGKFSTELCGGCHVSRTGDIGLFKIVSESGIAAGVRRIEAVTGVGALAYVAEQEQVLRGLCDLLKSSPEAIHGKVQQLLSQGRSSEKELEQLKAKMASSAGSDLASQAIDLGGNKLLAAAVDGFNPKDLRDTVDQLKNKLGSSIVLLATASEEGKVSLVAGVSKDLTDKIKAGELVNMVASQVGGKGGGRPDMAMAGGNDASQLPQAVGSVEAWVSEKLGM